MKINHPFHSTRTRCAALLVAVAALAVTFNNQAAKPQPSEDASLEVLVTGDLPSAPDHTGAVDGSYDICRAKGFSGVGAAKLGLRQLRLDLSVISAFAPMCVNPGVPAAGAGELWFPDDTASTDDAVDATYHFHGTDQSGSKTVTYHLGLIGAITGGQWPPPDGTTLEITFFAWTGLYVGAKEKNACTVTPTDPIPFANPVVFTITRNDAGHTDEECDCPFDYPVDLICP